MTKFKAIIIEDEPLARERLLSLLETYEDQIEVVAEADNGIQALEKIKELKPDLIFLDIQMPGLNGFQVLRELNKDEIPLVVFTTAYDEYALNAFETNAIDYLLKPIETDKLERAIEKLGKFHKEESYDQAIDKLMTYISKVNHGGSSTEKNDKYKRLQVKIGDEILFINLEDICYFKAEGKYSEINTFDEHHLSNYSFSQLAEILPERFVKVHRSFIVNLDRIIKLKKWFGGSYRVEIDNKGKEVLPVSKSLKDNLLTQMSRV